MKDRARTRCRATQLHHNENHKESSTEALSSPPGDRHLRCSIYPKVYHILRNLSWATCRIYCTVYVYESLASKRTSFTAHVYQVGPGLMLVLPLMGCVAWSNKGPRSPWKPFSGCMGWCCMIFMRRLTGGASNRSRGLRLVGTGSRNRNVAQKG